MSTSKYVARVVWGGFKRFGCDGAGDRGSGAARSARCAARGESGLARHVVPRGRRRGRRCRWWQGFAGGVGHHLFLVDVVGWHPDNAPALLGAALGARAQTFISAPIGGETGLSLINAAARRIAAGQSQVAFVGGAHALKSLRAAVAQRVKLPWPKGGSGALPMLSEARPGETELERRHGLEQPSEFYPLFENALRTRRRRELQAHRSALGQLFSPMTRVAAHNPYAWFPLERSADELSQVSPRNRMIAYPRDRALPRTLPTHSPVSRRTAS